LKGKKRKNNLHKSSSIAKKQKTQEKVKKSNHKTSSIINENEIPTFYPNIAPDLGFQKNSFTGFETQQDKQVKKVLPKNTLKIFNADILTAPLKKPINFKWTKYSGTTPKKKLF
jgi:hypothetical protein